MDNMEIADGKNTDNNEDEYKKFFDEMMGYVIRIDNRMCVGISFELPAYIRQLSTGQHQVTTAIEEFEQSVQDTVQHEQDIKELERLEQDIERHERVYTNKNENTKEEGDKRIKQLDSQRKNATHIFQPEELLENVTNQQTNVDDIKSKEDTSTPQLFQELDGLIHDIRKGFGEQELGWLTSMVELVNPESQNFSVKDPQSECQDHKVQDAQYGCQDHKVQDPHTECQDHKVQDPQSECQDHKVQDPQSECQDHKVQDAQFQCQGHAIHDSQSECRDHKVQDEDPQSQCRNLENQQSEPLDGNNLQSQISPLFKYSSSLSLYLCEHTVF